MSSQKAAVRGLPFTLQNGVTTGVGTALAIPSSFSRHAINIKGGTGVSAGAIQIEYADQPDYAGTWIPIGSPITVVADKQVGSQFTGLYPFIRARVSTDITAGVVTVTYTGDTQ